MSLFMPNEVMASKSSLLFLNKNRKLNVTSGMKSEIHNSSISTC